MEAVRLKSCFNALSKTWQNAKARDLQFVQAFQRASDPVSKSMYEPLPLLLIQKDHGAPVLPGQWNVHLHFRVIYFPVEASMYPCHRCGAASQPQLKEEIRPSCHQVYATMWHLDHRQKVPTWCHCKRFLFYACFLSEHHWSDKMTTNAIISTSIKPARPGRT